MAVYALALLKITDREAYGVYERGFMEVFRPYGGKFLAVDEGVAVKEGDWPHSRTVLIEFPDAATFEAWYHSPEYQALAQHRFAGSSGALVMLTGMPARRG
jgi:uncharacterized protein (DUF1330 family)